MFTYVSKCNYRLKIRLILLVEKSDKKTSEKKNLLKNGILYAHTFTQLDDMHFSSTLYTSIHINSIISCYKHRCKQKMFVVTVLCLLVSCALYIYTPNGKIYNSKPYIATINLKQNDNVCFSH